jgi:nucleoside-diphosphate-sugar epimerase
MNILLTGSTGFVGQHVVPLLLSDGHDVSVIIRNENKLDKFTWSKNVTRIVYDLDADTFPFLSMQPVPDVLLHLAWSGLHNFESYFHIESNLPRDLKFLKSAVQAGIKRLIVTGTSLEFGMQYGPLAENGITLPTTTYGLAKDTLRKSLQLLQVEIPFNLQWARLFYMYGEGQNSNSLIAQLDRAIREERSIFDMSKGEQLRDYLPVTQVAAYLSSLVKIEACTGVINICSGSPVSVRSLVEARCEELSSMIKLNLGHYQYPKYEPMAFWGQVGKLKILT